MQSKILNNLLFIANLLFIDIATASIEVNAPDPIPFESNIDQIDKKVFFLYYSRDNRDKPKKIWQVQENAYHQSNYITKRETVFVTHGWNADSKSDACTTIKNGYLNHGEYNVIVVDWSKIAKNDNYSHVASYVKAVGKYVSRHINFVIDKGIKPDDIHLVGHSFGAHLMGLAGYLAKEKVAHIVALDPAGPGFTKHKSDGRVSKESGKYVEVIHTSTFGMNASIGHVDYYPNGGHYVMPGCEWDPTVACSHCRAYYYYQESLENPEKWYARLCDSYEKFLAGKCNNEKLVPFARWTAHGIDRPLNKKYYLRTNSESPYGLGVAGTKPYTDRNDLIIFTKKIAKNTTKYSEVGMRRTFIVGILTMYLP